MSRQALQSEIGTSRQLIQNGGVNSARPPGCNTPESHQLDFWLGEWDIVNTGRPGITAEATIKSANQGCTILEEFRNFRANHGNGVFAYDTSVNKWRQAYSSASGLFMLAEGNFTNGALTQTITSPAELAGRRINFVSVDANTVHQWAEREDSATHAWITLWDMTYHRRSPPR